MIARWSFAVLMLILSGWLYLLTALVMRAIDRAEQIIDREHRVLPEDETPEAEGGDRYARLKAAAEWANARMQPTFLEPEPEPVPAVRPSPVPRHRETPLVTEPMEIADELAADAHAYVAREEVLSDEEWQAKQDAEHAAFMAWLAGETKEVGS